ncbi:MAG: aminomethyl-transferring glycine dehydrogenase [Ignavibacteria bacterium]|nr:aminomethyl-transferring glycine dehydrogenase [Ignavibacteria bacterium]
MSISESVLNNQDKFVNRHIGPDEVQVKEMLDVVGVNSLDQLINETIPSQIKLNKKLKLEEPLSEYKFLENLKSVSSKNKIYKSYIGMGYYPTITPQVILRNVLENPGWYTQYTPYQAEISQGRLEALLNFQTMICDLTAMDIANASLLDEGTAATEAMLMFFHSRSAGKKNSNSIFVSQDCYPQTIDVIKTRANPLGINVITGDHRNAELTNDVFAVVVQYPSADGEISDFRNLFEEARGKDINTIVAADLMSLILLTPPGEFGADCVVGSTQRFGVPMGYGGPHAAYFATKDKFKRQIPGRIIGLSIDVQGNKAYRMALQTREQHIKREKATSNICTAQVLLAIAAGMYAVYHGPEGIKAIADKIYFLTNLLNSGLNELGFKQVNKYFFDTIKVELDKNKLSKLKKSSEENGINFRYFENAVGISISEITEIEDIKIIFSLFEKLNPERKLDFDKLLNNLVIQVPEKFERQSKYLTHPVFNSYHSETEMLRYLKNLENKDLSLTTSMIPLGSCTMKLNATTEMAGLTWPEFGNIHPFVPLDQAQGYAQIINELSDDLKEITGFQGISLQPNSGAQGEYTGLMVIRQYHIDRGDLHRNICLIPSSAHGTNPASAVMAGMKVVVVSSDPTGNIDMEDLKKKAEQYKESLAALMVTYPSTHGIYEETIQEICDIIHNFGGQVYMDGANMNAQVGLTSPAMIGADVCHLNLHKTFCIPHGGGGPGMGPIGVAAHLIPFLPSHPVINTGGEKSITAVSAAPWGSPSILVISYAYIKMMGEEGLKRATEIAILNANYIKEKLKDDFKTLYEGKEGRVAHELIFDMRSFKTSAKVEVEDIAKRLMDYNFHAPTVSFPVPGTLMVEPTESESKSELDRFCQAMKLIREEIREIESGEADVLDNVLKNAPHTCQSIVSGEWNHPYSREKAVFPLVSDGFNKFWPSVARIDNAYGDRNLVCSCNPISDYAEENVN